MQLWRNIGCGYSILVCQLHRMCSHTIFKFCLKTRNQKTSLLNCLFQLCKNANLVKQPKAHVVIRLLGLLLCFFLGSSWSSCHLGGSNRGCHSEGRRVSQEGLNLQEERRSSSKEPMSFKWIQDFTKHSLFLLPNWLHHTRYTLSARGKEYSVSTATARTLL